MALLFLGSLAAAACTEQGAKTQKKSDGANQGLNAKPATPPKTDTGTKTGTSTKKDTSTDTSAAAGKRTLFGPFRLDVQGTAAGKSFSRTQVPYTFAKGKTSFDVLPADVTRLLGVNSVSYESSGSTFTMIAQQSTGRIKITMGLSWSSDDHFKATKKSCTREDDGTAGVDGILGNLACQQLSALTVDGQRDGKAEAPAGSDDEDETED